jgi:hypothetical protein
LVFGVCQFERPQLADSWTVGAVLAPRSIPALGNLTITADYYNIEITDVISGFPRQFSLPDADADPSAGEVGRAKDRFTANASYLTDAFKVGLTGTFIGKSYEDDLFDGLLDYSVPSYFVLDMNAAIYADEKFEFDFGADNLLDKDAPNIFGSPPFFCSTEKPRSDSAGLTKKYPVAECNSGVVGSIRRRYGRPWQGPFRTLLPDVLDLWCPLGYQPQIPGEVA